MRTILVLLVALLFGLNGCSSDSTGPSEQTPKPTTGIVAGYVYNAQTNQRLANARISIAGGGTTITTNAQGEFKFTGLVPGGYSFIVNKNDLGVGRSSEITIAAGDSIYSPMGLHPVTGIWNAVIQWQGRSAVTGTLSLKGDQTWTISGQGGSASGTWTLTYDQLTLSFVNGTQYFATVTDELHGTMVDSDGDTGFWSATR